MAGKVDTDDREGGGQMCGDGCDGLGREPEPGQHVDRALYFHGVIIPPLTLSVAPET